MGLRFQTKNRRYVPRSQEVVSISVSCLKKERFHASTDPVQTHQPFGPIRSSLCEERGGTWPLAAERVQRRESYVLLSVWVWLGQLRARPVLRRHRLRELWLRKRINSVRYCFCPQSAFLAARRHSYRLMVVRVLWFRSFYKTRYVKTYGRVP